MAMPIGTILKEMGTYGVCANDHGCFFDTGMTMMVLTGRGGRLRLYCNCCRAPLWGPVVGEKLIL